MIDFTGGAKMELQGSIIREQGITFAIVIVKKHVIDNRTEADEMVHAFRMQVFRGLPVILMAQDSRGVPTYYGRDDIVRFLANIHPGRIPWKKYRFD
jgi:hypothetical protein